MRRGEGEARSGRENKVGREGREKGKRKEDERREGVGTSERGKQLHTLPLSFSRES